MEGFKRSELNKPQTREEVRFDVLEWYRATAGREPLQQCEVSKPHDSELHWWLEPEIPGQPTPVVIEQEKLDGQWTIRIEPREQKIRVFT